MRDVISELNLKINKKKQKISEFKKTIENEFTSL